MEQGHIPGEEPVKYGSKKRPFTVLIFLDQFLHFWLFPPTIHHRHPLLHHALQTLLTGNPAHPVSFLVSMLMFSHLLED